VKVSWKLDNEDVKDAVAFWLREQYGVTIDREKIHITAWADRKTVTIEAVGIVEQGVALGPYR
jgi:predicted transcriptional regulator